MDVVIAHFKEFYIYYIFGLLLLLPFIFLTRKWSLPVILYAIEVAIYWGLMHVSVFVIVKVAAWFKDQSSMKRAFSEKTFESPDWNTPIVNFWERESYSPHWLFWVEVTLAVIVLLLVLRYRPMKVQHKKTRRSFKTEGQRRSALPPQTQRKGNTAGQRGGARRSR